MKLQVLTQLKTVFIIAQDRNKPLENSELELGDILQLDFEESHYSLPLKDLAFLEFIGDHCSNLKYAFKVSVTSLLIVINGI